jgi:hypothetical protein
MSFLSCCGIESCGCDALNDSGLPPSIRTVRFQQNAIAVLLLTHIQQVRLEHGNLDATGVMARGIIKSLLRGCKENSRLLRFLAPSAEMLAEEMAKSD